MWVVVLTARVAQFVETFLPLLLVESLGAGPGAIAVVLAMQQASATLANATVGRLVRRVGLTSGLRWGLLGSATAVAGLALAGSLPAAAAASAVYGASTATWRAAVQALVPRTLADPGAASNRRDVSTEQDDSVWRSRAFGAIFWAANIGAVASGAAGVAGLPLAGLFSVQAAMTTVALLLSFTLPARGDRLDAVPEVPTSQQPTPDDLRRARHTVGWLMIAFVPSTMVMFQAFGGLAVAMPADAYRQMVLVNATVLVLGQPLMTPVFRRFGAAPATVVAILAMSVGIAAQAVWPYAVAWTVLWTLGELVVIVVPGALITAATPTAMAADHIGRFQVVQGIAAAAALYAGPLLAGSGQSPFVVVCLVTGAVGAVGLLRVRTTVEVAWGQPLTCPCGAVFCVCSHTHSTCADPSAVPVWLARPTPHRDPNPTH